MHHRPDHLLQRVPHIHEPHAHDATRIANTLHVHQEHAGTISWSRRTYTTMMRLLICTGAILPRRDGHGKKANKNQEASNGSCHGNGGTFDWRKGMEERDYRSHLGCADLSASPIWPPSSASHPILAGRAEGWDWDLRVQRVDLPIWVGLCSGLVCVGLVTWIWPVTRM